jgi:small-conductance mechanosensitive channel
MMTRLLSRLDLNAATPLVAAILAMAFLAAPPAALAQQPAAGPTAPPVETAPVIIDGTTLFRVRGATAYPAERRAERIRTTIIEVAGDTSIGLDEFNVEHLDDRSTISVRGRPIVNIYEVDAQVESLDRNLLSQVYLGRILEVVADYREARSGGTLLRNAAFMLAITGVLVVLLWGTRALFRRLDTWIERHVKKGVQELASKSHYIIQAGPLWGLIAGLLRLLRVVIYLVLVYFYLNTVLGLFPWTRPAAKVLLQLILNPLLSVWTGFVGALPNLIFLVVLWFLVRYALKMIKAFFRGVGIGRIKLASFEAEWADPTYKIVRIAVIAFAIVLAYPYIPGSDSAAFKGVSVFLGVLLSLGSSSFIANLIAGLSMTYRGAFREGDLIRIGETTGTVEDVKLMVTRLRTPKNEKVILPNSNILSTDVINYTQAAKSEGLIVHSTVGIGYDTPWRQVEAMLLEAVSRTEGLQSDPSPFVLQEALGDFAVQYQVNAYWSGGRSLPRIRSDLHAHIQDVFNENGVQIMSPAYEADPEQPKVVPPERWFEAPAQKPEQA